MKLILASASPRRREILKNAGYEFEAIAADADETLPPDVSPEQAVKYLAELKNGAAAQNNVGIIISADTVVAVGGRLLGKPADEKDAENMLKTLSGRTHSVFTGVCVSLGNKKTVFCEKTEVTFFNLSEKEILDYIKTGEPMDKAGAYGIQGKGALFVKKINGDYFNVVGLPIARLSRVLRDFYEGN